MSSRKSGPGKLTCYFWVRDQLLPQTECSPAEASVLLQLAGYGNPDGTSIRPGNPNLVAVTKLNLATVKDAIKFWKRHSSGVLLEVSPGGGRKHAAVFSIRMFDIEPKGVHQTPVSENKGVHQTPVSTDKGGAASQERGVQRGAPDTPTESPNKDHRINHHPQDHTAACGKPDDDYHQKLLKFKTNVLSRSEDPQGTISIAFDILIERVEANGIRVNSPTYFEKALCEFFESQQDVELLKQRLHGAPL